MLRIRALPEPPVVWSHPTNGTEPARVGTGAAETILAIGPGGREVFAVDPSTGSVRWRRAAPTRITLGALEFAAPPSPPVVLVSGYGASSGWLGRLEQDTGRFAWQSTTLPSSDLSIALDGTGAEAFGYGECRTTFLDIAAGKVVGPQLPGTRVEMFGHGPPGIMCRRSAHLHTLRNGIVIASHMDRRERGMVLSGFASAGAPSWTVSSRDRFVRTLHVDPSSAVFAMLGNPTTIIRIDPPSGRVMWSQDVRGMDSCDDPIGPYAYVLTGARGGAESVFVRDCGEAVLLRLDTGQPLWRQKVGKAAAFLEAAAGHAWDTEDTVMVSSTSEDLAVQWISSDGRLLERVRVPGDTREMVPVPGGVVFTTNDLEGAGMIGRDGTLRWNVGVRFGNAFAVDDRFVLLDSATTAQVMVNVQDGSCAAWRHGSPWVLGWAGASPRVWVTTRSGPDAVVGIRM